MSVEGERFANTWVVAISPTDRVFARREVDDALAFVVPAHDITPLYAAVLTGV